MLIGPLPTPGIAYMTRRFNCDFGVVISASHNLYDDNGIKFFDATGAQALRRARGAHRGASSTQPPITRTSRNLGRATRVDTLAHALPGFLRLDAADGRRPRRA